MIPVTDLKRPEQEIRSEIDAALARVARRGRFVLGPEGEAFERAFAAFCGSAHCIGVGSGTDALQIALMACEIGPGDEVITVSLTSVATVCAVERIGARPVLVDVNPETLTMDPDAIPAALTKRTRAILPVHLHGSPADLEPILRLAGGHGLAVIEDCAHAHGARYRGKRAGSWGTISAFSFYPTKNLGAHGDGGAVVTDDPDLAERARRIRQYGWDSDRISRCKGFNSRLDEMQAAVLGVKLGSLEKWNAERRALAEGYDRGLRDSSLRLPVSLPDTTHVYYTYAVRHPHRDALREHLARSGISTAIHYPVPVHLQPAYADLGLASGSLPATEAAARELLTLPLFPGMRRAELEQVIGAIRDFRPEF
jgi:dTDP-4-amino-4,6-dideoxygalactose transaminase